MNHKKTIMGIMYLILIVSSISLIIALPFPHLIKGYILESDAETQANYGTIFSINNTNTGYYIEGMSGRSLNPGKYVSVVEGNDGDTIIITANNLTHQGNRTVVLQGSMSNVNVILNTSRENTAPSITSTPLTNVEEDSSYYYDVNALDDILDTLIYSLSYSPEGMNISNITGLISWTPDNFHVGLHEVIIYVNDSLGGFDNQSFLINVTPVNDRPVINSTPFTNVTLNETYHYNISAYDIDNQNSISYDDNNITYHLMSAPIGMIINSTSGHIYWTPIEEQAGSNVVIINVSDGSLETYQTFIIKVLGGDPSLYINNSLYPNVTSSPNTQATEDDIYYYDVNAEDALYYSLIYSYNNSLINISTNMTIDKTSGLIIWNPDNDDVGLNNITVIISNLNFSIDHSFIINVSPVNDVPYFISSPILSADEGVSYTYQVDIVDLDNENDVTYDDNNISYKLTTAPTGMSINNDGLITWTPGPTQRGYNPVVIEVNDTYSKVTQSFSIFVDGIDSGGWTSYYGGSWHYMSKEEIEYVEENVAYLVNVEEIEKDTPKKVEITKDEICITDFEVIVKENVKSASIDVERLTSRPKTVDFPPGNAKVYQYLEIKKENLTNDIISNVTITFKVDKSWVEKYYKSVDDVVMTRFNGGVWNDLETSFFKEDNSTIYYKSITPGFSYFAVTFKADDSRPKIDNSKKIFVRDINVPYHIHGSILYKDSNIGIIEDTEIVFENLNTSRVFKTSVGDGPVAGVYSVLLEGSYGDTIKVSTSSWSTIFILEGDKEINFETSIKRPVFLSPLNINVTYFMMVLMLIIFLFIFVNRVLHHQDNKK